MDSALSLKTGKLVRASEANYASGRSLVLVCPKCKEPVHLCRRFRPRSISYFAHPDVGRAPVKELCPLRVVADWCEPYPTAPTSWTSHGQLIKKFQAQLVSYFLDQFAKRQDLILRFLNESLRSQPTLSQSQERIVESLTSGDAQWPSAELRQIAALPDKHGRDVLQGFVDILAYLRTDYASAISHGLVLCATLAATCLGPIQRKADSVIPGVRARQSTADFALDPKKLASLMRSGMPPLRSTSRGFADAVQLARYLILRAVVLWRYPDALLRERYLLVASSAKSIAVPESSNPRRPVVAWPSRTVKSFDRPTEPVDVIEKSIANSALTPERLLASLAKRSSHLSGEQKTLHVCPTCGYLARSSSPTHNSYVCWRCGKRFSRTGA